MSFHRASTDHLLARVIDLRADLRGARLLTLAPPRLESIPGLLCLFHSVFGLVEGSRWLPDVELVAALLCDDRSDRFLGGNVDPQAKALTLLRGDLSAMVVPVALFRASGDGIRPDFSRLGFTDHGRTVVLGAYDAAADALLYELDPDYRRRLNRRRRHEERSCGASVLRLRKQRGLRRSDFRPVSAKEVARIERNEVERPHPRTLRVLADRLRVRPEEIESY